MLPLICTHTKSYTVVYTCYPSYVHIPNRTQLYIDVTPHMYTYQIVHSCIYMLPLICTHTKSYTVVYRCYPSYVHIPNRTQLYIHVTPHMYTYQIVHSCIYMLPLVCTHTKRRLNHHTPSSSVRPTAATNTLARVHARTQGKDYQYIYKTHIHNIHIQHTH